MSLNGIQLHTTVGVLGQANQVTRDISSTTIVYSVPASVSTQLVMVNNGYLHSQVQFVTSGASWTPGQPIPVTVTVTMQAKRTFTTGMMNTETSNLLSWTAGTSDAPMVSSFLVAPANGAS